MKFICFTSSLSDHAFKELTVYQTFHCAFSAFNNITLTLAVSNTPFLADAIQPE